MATQTLTQRIALDGGKEIEAELKALGRAGEAAFKQLKAAADASAAGGGFGAKLSAGIASFKAQFAGVAAAGVAFGRSFGETNRALGEVGRAFVDVGRRATTFIAIVAGLEFGFAKLAKSSVEAAGEIDDLAKATGLSSEEFQQLRFAAGVKGLATDQLVQGIIRLNKVLASVAPAAKHATESINGLTVERANEALKTDARELAESNGRLTQTFDGLGITVTRFSSATDKAAKSAKDVKKSQDEANIALGDGEQISAKAADALKALGVTGVTVNDKILSLADALNKIPDAQQRLGLEAQLFGKGLATGFDAFLREGADGIKELEALFKATGGVLSEEEIRIADKAKLAFSLLDASVTGLKNHIGLALAPAIGTLAQGLSQLIAENVGAIRQFVLELSNKAIPIIKDFVAALSGNRGAVQNKGVLEFIDQVDQLKEHLLAIVSVAGTVFKGIQAAAGVAAAAITAFSGGLIKLNGNTLLAIVSVGKFLGLGKALAATFNLGLAAFRNFKAGLDLLIAGFTALRAAALFFVATPLGLAITAIVAATTFLATRQSAAAKAADQHAQAMDELRQAQLAAAAGGKEERDRLVELEQAHLTNAKAALADAESELAAARVRAQATQGVAQGFNKTAQSLFGASDQGKRFEETLSGLDKAQSMVSLRKQQLDEYVNAIRFGVDATRQLTGATQQAGQAAQSSFGVVRSVSDAAAGSIRSAGQAAEQTFGAVRSVADAAKPAAAGLAKVGDAAQRLGDAAPDVEKVKSAADEAFATLRQKAEETVAAILQAFTDLGPQISSVMAEVSNTVTSIFNLLQNNVITIAGQVQSSIAQIIASLQAAVAQAQALAAAAQAAAAAAASAGSGFAFGGPVTGPGTSTSDSILARLSTGEFVLSARAVKHWGVGFLAAMNSLRLTRDDFRGFSLGGLVADLGASFTASVPRFADGGLALAIAAAPASPARTVRLEFQLGDEVFVAQTDETTVAQISRVATRERMKRIGRPQKRIAR